MPNHCAQRLVITGPSDLLRKFIEFANDEKEEEVLSANKFIPYPKTFENEHEYKTWYAKEGHDWCIDNWGTKWGIYDSSLTKQNLDNETGEIVYVFYSAWEPANKIIIAMAEQYPQLSFGFTYEERGMGFKGKLILEDGKIVEETYEED